MQCLLLTIIINRGSLLSILKIKLNKKSIKAPQSSNIITLLHNDPRFKNYASINDNHQSNYWKLKTHKNNNIKHVTDRHEKQLNWLCVTDGQT